MLTSCFYPVGWLNLVFEETRGVKIKFCLILCGLESFRHLPVGPESPSMVALPALVLLHVISRTPNGPTGKHRNAAHWIFLPAFYLNFIVGGEVISRPI